MIKGAAIACALLAAACGSKKADDGEPGQTRATPRDASGGHGASGPWLWRAEKAGKTSWIFGIGPRGVAAAETPPTAIDALGASERLVVDYVDGEAAVGQDVVFLPEGETLEILLGTDVYRRVVAYTAGRVDAAVLPRLRPWFVVPLLGSTEIPASDVAGVLVERHRANRKEVVALKPFEGHGASIAEAAKDGAIVRDILNHTAEWRGHEYDGPQTYRRGNIAQLEAMLLARNRKFPGVESMRRQEVAYLVPKLDAELARGGAFYAANAELLIMKHGIFDELEKLGYAITRAHPGDDVVIPDMAPRWTTPEDCRAGYERVVTIASELAGADGEAMTDEELAALRKETITVESLNNCLQLPLDRVECMKAAANRDAWTECLTDMLQR